MLVPGALVGARYRIVRALGRGGMGEVYEAVHEALSRRVAIKTILPHLASDPALFARFRREAESAAALGHPNIVQVTDFQSLPGEPPLIVMELLDGVTLDDILEREGKLQPARAAFIGMQMLSGLAAAHRAGIIHRDVKPGNVVVTSTLAVRDLVKLVDFGIAKLVEDAHGRADTKVTAFGQVLGTLAYMAPEQALGHHVDARVDLYAVGATLYHALSGFSTFDARSPGTARPPLAQIAPWLDARLASVIDRALAPSPLGRWATAEAMAEALAPFASPEASPSTGPATPLGLDAGAAARLSAPTGAGSAPYGPSATSPTAYAPSGTSPTAYAPTGVMPPPGPMFVPLAPVRAAPPASSHRWIVPVVAAFAALSVIAIFAAYAMMWRATNPSAIEAQTEKAFLENTRFPACPSPDACTETHQDHGVSFPVCTKRAPKLTPIVNMEMILAKRDGVSRVALVDTAFGDGRYYVRWVTSGKTADIREADVVGRLCGIHARRVP